ncbi:hypothetical protein SLEP1_g56952 [Rubroshorea leprosula]|uniref:Uncharacterized protein n=1 Tax=Rubroshorea leprosula TaxID=152421 RepID=A0AAV5MK86_9ROSI|nr:hypothetical protein SLEP1_g56952 [Rubroshorea leprosula]
MCCCTGPSGKASCSVRRNPGGPQYDGRGRPVNGGMRSTGKKEEDEREEENQREHGEGLRRCRGQTRCRLLREESWRARRGKKILSKPYHTRTARRNPCTDHTSYYLHSTATQILRLELQPDFPSSDTDFLDRLDFGLVCSQNSPVIATTQGGADYSRNRSQVGQLTEISNEEIAGQGGCVYITSKITEELNFLIWCRSWEEEGNDIRAGIRGSHSSPACLNPRKDSHILNVSTGERPVAVQITFIHRGCEFRSMDQDEGDDDEEEERPREVKGMHFVRSNRRMKKRRRWG